MNTVEAYQLLLIQIGSAHRTARRLRLVTLAHILSMAALEAQQCFIVATEKPN